MSSASTPVPDTDHTRRRRPTTRLTKVGMGLFAVGLLAILADLVLFSTGSTDLPLWLNLVCLLAPIGLGLGLVGVVRETRRASPALVARARAAASAKANRKDAE